MKRLLKAVLLCLLPLCAAAQTDGEEPIITIHSSAYTEVGESNQFSFLIGASEPTYLDIDLGAGKNEVEVGVASVDTETGEFKGTWIPARADANGIIKIYGDASKIDVLVMDGAYITSIDMDACRNLEILSMEHNVLRSLDLTPFTKLAAIYLTDNPFTEATPLVIGGPKPALQILEVDIVDHLDPDFNLSDYPSLIAFDAYHTLSLNRIDPTGCPQLRTLSLEMTAVETVDVSKNPLLTSLNISESRVRQVDLSKNVNLVRLIAGHASGTINTDVKMDHIDISNNPNLVFLSLTGNNLTGIDLSKNPYIQTLILNGNRLSSLDLSANTNLYSVNVMNNDMDYATLPLPDANWGEYFYLQRPMPVSRVLGVGETLDLSNRVLREGTETSVTVMRKPFTGEAVAVDEALYSYADGKITFNSAIADSVYVQYSNSVFNEYRMMTTSFCVKNPEEIGVPTKVIGLNLDPEAKSLKLNLGIAGATAASPKSCYIDFGDGVNVEYSVTGSTLDGNAVVEIVPTASYHGRINILMPEGNDLTAFGLDGVTIHDIDLTAATTLRQLSLTNASIYSIDLRYNPLLTYLDLSGNNLTDLSLLGIYGDFEKNILSTLRVADNKLTNITLRDGSSIKTLDLSGNRFVELPMSEFDNVEDIDLSDNLLAGELSLTYQLNTSRINISGNPVTSLKLDTFSNLAYFNVSETELTFATLPLPDDSWGEYIYSPLRPVTLQEMAPAVNLTDQNINVAGRGTTFVWRKTDGTALVQGVDIDCVDGGTRFLKDDLGDVYCEMTNPAFPGLTLTTTPVRVVGAPTTVVATFTARANAAGELIVRGRKNSALYIDWRGDGTELIEYPYSSTAVSNYNFNVSGGNTARIYTYGDPADVTVFSIYNTQMSDIDLTPMTGLTALAIGGAGLTPEQMQLPDAPIVELNLGGNKLTSYPYAAKYPKMQVLTLNDNGFTTFDASILPSLKALYIANNRLTSVKFNNPNLWDIHLSGNQLEEVNLSGLSSAQQIFLNNNRLTTIDLKPVKFTLRALSLVSNRFTFATLPRAEEAPYMSVMYYGRQEPLSVECVNGTVDLSSQAMVDGTATKYVWYLGEATYDSDLEAYVGEELIEDVEYTLEDGVTTFKTTFGEKVMCVMLNEMFPSLQLTTDRIFVDAAGIDNVIVDREENAAPNGCYDLNGRRVDNPGRGIYIINGRKVLVR